MEVVLERLLVELVAIALQLALLRILAWVRARSASTVPAAA
jgi:hypothetical protein